ncbi:hypothetical protein LTR86_008464 [Recurvomyces mirabilis]|nr:hypothetical protein LTR86_008464 [Recurvomyces mirabilis]
MSLQTKLETPERVAAPSSIERVEAWTVSQVADAISAVSIESPTPKARTPRGATVTIDIPLDDSVDQEPLPRSRAEAVHTVHKRRQPVRRDSLNRRDALLKGKEGSRRRQKWENDRLLSNPWAEPPLPSDWEVQPTHPRQTVPYFLAPLWDAEYARTARERQKRAEAARAPQSKEDAEVQKVTRELRAKLKKSRGAKGLLQDLEAEVRGFIEQWEAKQAELEKEGLIDPDSEDEEIVFVGRNGVMSDEMQREKDEETLEKDKLIFQSLVDDHGAAFGRYLVHSIAAYYGLQTWSVTTGNPARREAYVGLKLDPQTRRPSLNKGEMPRPLWAVVLGISYGCRPRRSSTLGIDLDTGPQYSTLGLEASAHIGDSAKQRPSLLSNMCQVCGIKLAAAQARWPKPLEASITDINLLVGISHDEYAKNEAACTNRESIPEALLEVLRLLAAAVESLETDRAKWWAAPEKRELRRRLEADCDQKRLTELHKINNTTIERIETMQAKLSGFLKWSLGINGGVWELVESEKVVAKAKVALS